MHGGGGEGKILYCSQGQYRDRGWRFILLRSQRQCRYVKYSGVKTEKEGSKAGKKEKMYAGQKTLEFWISKFILDLRFFLI